ncbi:hypothetical protein VNO78_00755 [Psophocarpus tetragonolobus]|uniref:Uncharacterized protein n=1 Tax=Psophocarpus tetragonolobus TaxID=3891 RepID=A0AAN9XUU9_PSOTE
MEQVKCLAPMLDFSTTGPFNEVVNGKISFIAKINETLLRASYASSIGDQRNSTKSLLYLSHSSPEINGTLLRTSYASSLGDPPNSPKSLLCLSHSSLEIGRTLLRVSYALLLGDR